MKRPFSVIPDECDNLEKSLASRGTAPFIVRVSSPLRSPKIISLAAALPERIRERAAGQRCVLTNGCFDLLHAGHVALLEAAAQRGDRLWVLVNGDESVRSLKGAGRPFVPAAERAYLLASLACVDWVHVFLSERLDSEIQHLAPDVYVKGGDYTIDALDARERQALENVGARIEFVPFIEGRSTTRLVERIRQSGNVFP